MKKIEKLTKEQENQLLKFQKECLNIGLSTERIDKLRNQETVNWIYKKYLNIDKEPYIWYVKSPLQYNLIINFLNIKNNLWINLMNNLKNNLRNNLWNNLRNNLWNNLRNNLWNNLRNNLWNNLRNNLWNNLRNNLRNNLGDNLGDKKDFIFNNIYHSNLDIYWISFYMFPLLYMNISYGDLDKDITKYFEFQKNIGYVFYYKDICFISERPVEIHKKGIQLHNEIGPSVLFEDGYCLWNLNGVEVPRWLIETNKEDIDVNLILQEKNVEVRREILRKIGINSVVEKLNCEVIDKDKEIYELLKVPLGENIFGNYLKMKNPSISTYHLEGVPNECNTIEKALAWRNYQWNINKPFEKYKKPIQLT